MIACETAARAGGRYAALGVFAAVLAGYGATVVAPGRPATPQHSGYDRLAAALLRGELHIGLVTPDDVAAGFAPAEAAAPAEWLTAPGADVGPPERNDLTPHGGRWYVPFPPAPALLLAPLVALRGVDGVSTPLVSAVGGATAVLLVFLTLQAAAARGLLATRWRDHMWLAAMFAVGSVFWVVATDGTVWFLAHVTTVLGLALAAWLAVRTGNAWLSGAALALAVASRPHVLLVWPLLYGLARAGAALPDAGARRRHLWRWALASGVPLVLVCGGLAAYNQARFGSPLDFGYLAQNVAPSVKADLLGHGQFHPRFVPRNLWTMLGMMPDYDYSRGLPVPSSHGLSLILTTPAVLLALRAWRRRSEPAVGGAWLALGLVLVPLLTYYNTGWAQFGYRFSLDFMVPLTVLIAAAVGTRVTRSAAGLILMGLAVNAWGVLTWFHIGPYG